MIKLIKRKVNNLVESVRRRMLPKAVQARHEWVDNLEREMLKHEQVNVPIEDIFTQGLYTRVMYAPKGTVITSEIHKFEHPFFLLKGVVEVADVTTGDVEEVHAPHIGITKPYTRRIITVIEDTIWATTHVTTMTDPEKILDKILVDRDNGFVPQCKENYHGI